MSDPAYTMLDDHDHAQDVVAEMDHCTECGDRWPVDQLEKVGTRLICPACIADGVE